MSNMSYCRFENTSRDLYDCVEAIQHGEADPDELSENEKAGLRRIIKHARTIVEMDERGDFECITDTD